MKSTVSTRYEEKKRDYDRLREICGHEISDLCGAWCNTENLFLLLENPSKKTATRLYCSLISSYYSKGYDGPGGQATQLDLMDAEVYEIFKRNGDIE